METGIKITTILGFKEQKQRQIAFRETPVGIYWSTVLA